MGEGVWDDLPEIEGESRLLLVQLKQEHKLISEVPHYMYIGNRNNKYHEFNN